MVNFSAQTTAGQTQEIILGKLEKRKRGALGPIGGSKGIIFVDDLNMPSLEKYGAQPPIELLRQWMDHGEWFDLKDTSSMQLVDIQFIAAMGPPGGGRNPISSRFTRHFNTLAISEFDDSTMKHIFTTMLDWHFKGKGFTDQICDLSKMLVSTILDTYHAAVKNLLPTPVKSHYVFNLRDFSRVIQGLLLTTPEQFTDSARMIRLCTHELYRVFYDRLIHPEDRDWFFNFLIATVNINFSSLADGLFVHLKGEDGLLTDDSLRSLMFGDYVDTDRVYREVLC